MDSNVIIEDEAQQFAQCKSWENAVDFKNNFKVTSTIMMNLTTS
jgi:hypothetical protein